MTNRALKIGQLIANAHPADVRLLFQQYGITVEPTGKTILDAYLVYGDQFLTKLLNIANKSISRFSNTTGKYDLETAKLTASANANYAKGSAASAADTKATWSDKVFAVFSGAGTTLTTVAGAWNDISTIFNGGKVVNTGSGSADAALQAEMYRLQLEAEKEAGGNQTKTFLLIGAGILVAVLVVIMYLKNKS